MKAVFHSDASARLRARLTQVRDPRITVVEDADTAGFAREIADAEILLHVLRPVTAAVIAMAPRLKLIQKVGVGVDAIDRAAAARAGIAVANMPGTNTAAVAEHALALMLAVLRKVTMFDAAVRRGKGWDLPIDSREALGELGGSTIGLVGYGGVARHLAPALAALGADLRYFDSMQPPDAIARFMPLDELLAISDIISLHVPLTPATRHLIGPAAIARLKPGAVIINTARGELVDTVALAEAVRAGRIGGAGLDVFEREPFDAIALFEDCPTVVMTPHMAWLTPQTLERSIAVIEENSRRLAAGAPILHRIAPPNPPSGP